MARKFVHILVPLVLTQMFFRALTQQCTGGGSEKSILGWMLQRHIYKTMIADLPHACVLSCRKDDRCQSLNYAISLSMCEFSNRTKEARPGDFIPNPDRFYFRRDQNRVPLGSIPELPAETCTEIKASEGGQAVNKKYWFSSIKPGVAVLAYCDMKTEDVDECTAFPSVCDVNANCTNTRGSYGCTCKSGFSGNGKICKDVDECTAFPSVCADNANCKNTRGSYRCTCNSGFFGDGKTCKDVDECAQGSHDCLPSFASCINTVGSYNCTCNHGYVGDGKTSCGLDTLECQNYQSLYTTDRNVTYDDGKYRCDSGLGPGWFRFEGSAGTRMPSSCPPKYRCGAHATGWMNGAHPTVADGKAIRTVCFHWNRNCCNWSTNIRVRNCGSYYVYYLSGTGNGCSLRYCGSDD